MRDAPRLAVRGAGMVTAGLLSVLLVGESCLGVTTTGLVVGGPKSRRRPCAVCDTGFATVVRRAVVMMSCSRCNSAEEGVQEGELSVVTMILQYRL